MLMVYTYLEVDPDVPGSVACALFRLMKCVVDIQPWMVENKLMLNEDKTDSKHHWDLKKFKKVALYLGDAKISPSKSIHNHEVFSTMRCLCQIK